MIKLSVMEIKSQVQSVSPPRIIPSMLEGFNVVASHIKLILLPVLLDLLLWFGPHLRVRTLFSPLFDQLSKSMSLMSSPEVQNLLVSTQSVWLETLERFNLLTTLRTLPIGIPSLLSRSGFLENPVGQPFNYELQSLSQLAVVWLAIVLVGLAAGAMFFGEIARISLDHESTISLGRFFSQYKQTILFTVATYLIILILAVPLGIFISLVSMVNPMLTQIGIILMSLVLIWLLMPLIFSPHGIYGSQMNLFSAAMTSIRLVRYFLPGTGIFMLIAILLSQGLDILWQFPPENSWMIIIGIFGHAFVATGLVAASFIYYRGGIKWMNEKLFKVTGVQKTADDRAGS